MMPGLAIDQITQNILNQLQAQFSSASRLYDLSVEGLQEAGAPGVPAPAQTLMVEAYAGAEALHTTSQWSIIALSTDAHLDLAQMLGKVCQLHTALSDGSRTTTSGLIHHAALVGSEGGLARYQLSVVDWTWMLGQSLASRVWQGTTVLDIVGSIFARYAPHAAWHVSDEVGPFMEQAHAGSSPSGSGGERSYCVQYRETDLAFVQRLLAEEGLSWRVEEHPESPAKHRLVLFADSSQEGAFPEDPSSAHSLGGAGIRFHRGHAQEEQDCVQALSRMRQLPVGRVTLLSTDYKTKQSIAASAQSAAMHAGKNAPQLESYHPSAPYGVANRAAAQRQAELQAQALEARHQAWVARSTVRTLRAGASLQLVQAPLGELNDPQHPGFNVLSVRHLGINNLPKPAQEGLQELLGDVRELLPQVLQALGAECDAKTASSRRTSCASSYQNDSDNNNSNSGLSMELDAVLAQAQALGYANQCELIEAHTPWRPLLADGSGARLLARPTALGPQSAIVVGPNGTESDTSAGDVYTDALGRIRIRLHWQGQLGDADGATSGTAACWVRVAQRSAGAGMGLQFIPHVGQEVLVQFLGGDIDRPIVSGALYNGQGEGGTPPTPGGQTAKDGAAGDAGEGAKPFGHSGDHRASAQGNLMAAGSGGHSPAWFGTQHGASEGGVAAGGQANAAAQWGIRSKEWGNPALSGGYNQLVLDDNDAQAAGPSGGGNQQRIQLKTTQHASELNLGHLIHSADNHRGSLRGQGFELRTDAYGAVRAGAGLHLSTYSIQHSANARDPAGDNSAALALLKQAKVLSEAFNKAAGTHSTVKLASHVGSIQSAKSALDDQAAPLAALYKMAATQVSTQDLESAQSDAPQKSSAPKADKLPHSGDAILSLAGQGGIAAVAGQSLQWSNSETLSLMSGQDSQSLTGGSLRIHSGQAIGLLGGVLEGKQTGGEGGKGLTLIASKDPVRYEAQSNEIKIQAKNLVNIQSANAHIDWAAAKKISLSTAGGANITIEGGNITIQCPGKLTVHAASKKFAGPTSLSREMNSWPKSAFDQRYVVRHRATGEPMPNTKVQIIRADGAKIAAVTDAAGKLPLQKGMGPEEVMIKVLGKA